MKGVTQGRYTKEFREEAVKLVTEEKLSLPEAGMPPQRIPLVKLEIKIV